ncbi:MAG: hypothetical protein JF616_15090 [Fibrobacteres bacterium]|nr:hypothetical protein [Fibrobacterota bacterium]
MISPMVFAGPALEWAGSFALFLAAAKAHGRQLRLERERAGYFEVVFGGKNPAFVEGLWKQERLLFWSLAGALCAFALAYAVAAQRFAWNSPFRPSDGSVPPFWLLPLWGGVWPMCAAFIFTGALSVWRLRMALVSGPSADRHWLAAARLGSLGWWSLVLLLTCMVAAASPYGKAF